MRPFLVVVLDTIIEISLQLADRARSSRQRWRPLKSSSMLSTRQLYRSNNQPANYAALTQFAPEPSWKRSVGILFADAFDVYPWFPRSDDEKRLSAFTPALAAI